MTVHFATRSDPFDLVLSVQVFNQIAKTVLVYLVIDIYFTAVKLDLRSAPTPTASLAGCLPKYRVQHSKAAVTLSFGRDRPGYFSVSRKHTPLHSRRRSDRRGPLSCTTAAASALLPAALMAGEIIQSPHDKKQYRRVDLQNGLAVLLIHDPEVALALQQPEQAAVRQPATHPTGPTFSLGWYSNIRIAKSVFSRCLDWSCWCPYQPRKVLKHGCLAIVRMCSAMHCIQPSGSKTLTSFKIT